jgi:hypothetical protein
MARPGFISLKIEKHNGKKIPPSVFYHFITIKMVYGRNSTGKKSAV